MFGFDEVDVSDPLMASGNQSELDNNKMMDEKVSELNSDLNGEDEIEPLQAVKVYSIWVSTKSGEQLHLRQFRLDGLANNEAIAERTHSDKALPGLGRSVFMLHGEAECGRIYYDNKGNGLAWHLAQQGYEVFVADLGGRGRSLSLEEGVSKLSVYDCIVEAIPLMIQAAGRNSVWCDEQYRFHGPDIWVGHGFGAVMLSAAWTRLEENLRTARQMIFFSGKRYITQRSNWKNLFVKLLCHRWTEKWVGWKNLFPATRLGLGTADENASWYRTYVNWMQHKSWKCDQDGFDYCQALRNSPLPPTQHIASQSESCLSSLQDIRAFIKELGPHDARLLIMDKMSGDRRSYNHLSMLLDNHAVKDVFEPLSKWLSKKAIAFQPLLQTAADEHQEDESLHDLYEKCYSQQPQQQKTMGNADNVENSEQNYYRDKYEALSEQQSVSSTEPGAEYEDELSSDCSENENSPIASASIV